MKNWKGRMPKDDNPSRAVLDSGIREKMEEIVRKYVDAETLRLHFVQVSSAWQWISMKASEIVMNIALNLVRIARFAAEDRAPRVRQFTDETKEYLERLEKAERSSRFEPTFQKFKIEFERLRKTSAFDPEYIDDLHTWANILTHRAKLAWKWI